MSGHSKWATTKRAKAVTDAKRASHFTRLANAVTIAAREKGGDPSANFSLRLAIERARAGNMPKDNIERAIKRGTGELGGQQLEEIFYEGYGPGGVALIIKVLTDNRNRSVSDVKHILTKYGGSFGSAHSVLWMFEKKGVIGIQPHVLNDELELQLIERGIEDIQRTHEDITLIMGVEDLQRMKEYLEGRGIALEFSEFDYRPKTTTSISPDAQETFQKLCDALEDLDDVIDYYTNIA